jgi:hypothetical protein
MSAEFSYSENGLRVRSYTAGHVTASLSGMFDRETRTVVTVAHFPQSAEGAENPCHEFYSLEISINANEAPYNTSAIGAHLTREDIERLHFATGELLAQSEGLKRGAAHSRVVCDPQDEEKNAGCDSCGVNDRAEGFDTCQPCIEDAS